MTLEHQNIREQTIGGGLSQRLKCAGIGDSGPDGVVLVQVLRGAIFTDGVTVVRGEGVYW